MSIQGTPNFMEHIEVNDIADFIKSLKVAELKDHIRLINEQLPYSSHVRLSGTKADLTARLLEVVHANSHTPKRLQEFAMLIAPLGLHAYMRGLSNIRQASQYVLSADPECPTFTDVWPRHMHMRPRFPASQQYLLSPVRLPRQHPRYRRGHLREFCIAYASDRLRFTRCSSMCPVLYRCQRHRHHQDDAR